MKEAAPAGGPADCLICHQTWAGLCRLILPLYFAVLFGAIAQGQMGQLGTVVLRVLDGELLNSSALGLKAFLPTHATPAPFEEDARGLPTLRRFGPEQGTERHSGGILLRSPWFPRSITSTTQAACWFLSNSHHETVAHERNSSSRRCRARGQVEEVSMQDAKTYHQYAADCRRMASTMNVNDRKILLKMADAWDERAKEAERLKKTRADN